MQADDFTYDDITATTERRRLKAEKREKNKKLWAERNGRVGAWKEAGTSKVDDKKRIQMFKEELLSSENGLMVIRKIIHKALNDEDKDQAAMLRLCAERIVPISLFEENEGKYGITVIIDKTCGGTVTLREGVVEIGNNDSQGSPRLIEGEVINQD